MREDFLLRMQLTEQEQDDCSEWRVSGGETRDGRTKLEILQKQTEKSECCLFGVCPVNCDPCFMLLAAFSK